MRLTDTHMKILLVHSAYQHSGGEEAAVAQDGRLLESRGHAVVRYERQNDELRDASLARVVAAGIETIWASRSYRNLNQLLARERPDIAHFHNTFPLISPSAYYACAEAGVPVIQTLHNYRLVCPGALLMRGGRVCDDCLDKRVKWPAVLHGCYRESRLVTATVAGMIAFHHALDTWEQKVTTYVALSEFSRAKFVEGGLPAEKIVVKPNFVSEDPGVRTSVGDHALFVGRLSEEKGADFLIDAWAKGNRTIPLSIVGDGPLRSQLEQKKADFSLDTVCFAGALQKPLVLEAMRQARFVIVPSQCYENFPLVIAEAYACGVPVIAPRRGAMEEIVLDNVTGVQFEPDSEEDLAAKVEWAWLHPDEMREMGWAARREYEAKYTAEQNYKALMNIYERAFMPVC